MSLSPREMKEIYRRTVVIKRPTYGIVPGYHELPYICVGVSHDTADMSLCIEGKIHVSPRFIITPSHYLPKYEDVFGSENVDEALQGRIFGFLAFKDKPMQCSSEYLRVTSVAKSVDDLVASIQDDLARKEDIRTALIYTPDTRYYPISLERFIASVLEDEFSS